MCYEVYEQYRCECRLFLQIETCKEYEKRMRQSCWAGFAAMLGIGAGHCGELMKVVDRIDKRCGECKQKAKPHRGRRKPHGPGDEVHAAARPRPRSVRGHAP